ncbi:hypothetical protein MLD38_016302 [Melastoma candidum]|uniref:Uncharacterized protein n=1 Tax=Melastoma candidum TaxID=119954 RepID=A0ACB9RJ14_9MYRT|nr:hypothetical protein MLD38_016302 [Melastoma candidum]
MAQFEESIRNQITALLRLMSFSRSMNEDRVPSKIDDGLFLGSVGAANNKEVLKRLNVTHVLTVANSLKPPHPDDFTYKVIAVSDREDTNLRQYFDECFDFIDEANQSGGGALVHCFVGRSRSVTIVVAYMMKKHGMTYLQALEHVKSRRPQACPNSGFVSQLRDFEKSLRELASQDGSKIQG